MGLRVVRCRSVIILVINSRSSNFVITRMITDRIALHSVLLPLLIVEIEPSCVIKCWITCNHDFCFLSGGVLQISEAGEISVKSKLDREVVPSFTLVVLVSIAHHIWTHCSWPWTCERSIPLNDARSLYQLSNMVVPRKTKKKNEKRPYLRQIRKEN